MDTEDSMGGVVTAWQTVATVWAAIEPLSAREFLAGQQVNSQVVARITIRHRAGLHAGMRIVRGAEVYNIAGVLPDAVSGAEYVTLPVSRGVNAG